MIEKVDEFARQRSWHRFRGVPLRSWPTGELAYIASGYAGATDSAMAEAKDELVRRDAADVGADDVVIGIQRWVRSLLHRADSGMLTVAQAVATAGLLAACLRGEGADVVAEAVETALQLAAEDAAGETLDEAPADGGPADGG